MGYITKNGKKIFIPDKPSIESSENDDRFEVKKKPITEIKD